MRFIFFFFFLSIVLIGFAQQPISGQVEDEHKKPLANASITLHKKDQPAIIAFAISDKEGRFSIQYNGTINDSLQIKASLLGYAPASISFINGNNITFNFSLIPKAIELKEVRVKSPPVWQRKDTVNYKTDEFKQPQDRVIADIIARLPGMEVTPGGQIKYNGRPINKYYIEGLDLLEDKYGIANNNLPADAVDKIQVLENHQPIRVLDSVQFSDRAALNIKLKNNAKMKLIGRSRIGAGFSPLLGEAELTPMLFKRQFQFITTYKYNNTGTDNTREIASQNFSDYINAIQNGAVKNDLLSLVAPGSPPLQPQRWLFNNAHVASGNFLVPLSKTYQLRTNLSYVNDFQQQQGSVETNYYLPDDTVNIKEINKRKRYLNRLQTDFTLMANRPDYYLKNLLRFQADGAAERSRLFASQQINQQLKNPFFNLSNDFSLLKTGKKMIKEAGSYIGYVSLPQQLTIFPGLYENLINNSIPFTALQQDATLKTFYTDNFISFRKRQSKFASRHKVGFDFQSQQYNTSLLKDISGNKQSIGDTFQNKLSWQRLRFYLDNSWNYENAKWRLSLSVPLNYTRINYADKGYHIDHSKHAVFMRPYLSIMYQLNPKWNWNSSLSFNDDFGNSNGVSSGYVLKNYRSLSNNNAPLARFNSYSAASSITFRNPVKIFFFNLGINYTRTNSNLIYQQLFSNNLQTLLARLMDNNRKNLSFSGRISKYFIDMRTSISMSGSYSFNTLQQLQQEQLVDFKNRSLSTAITFNTKFSSRLTMDYAANYTKYSSGSQLQQGKTSIQNANQRISANYLPLDQIIINISAEHYYLQNSVTTSSNYYFADFSLRFQPKRKRIDFELALQNLFNNKEFATASVSNNVEIISLLELRPRQVLFKVSFSL